MEIIQMVVMACLSIGILSAAFVLFCIGIAIIRDWYCKW